VTCLLLSPGSPRWLTYAEEILKRPKRVGRRWGLIFSLLIGANEGKSEPTYLGLGLRANFFEFLLFWKVPKMNMVGTPPQGKRGLAGFWPCLFFYFYMLNKTSNSAIIGYTIRRQSPEGGKYKLYRSIQNHSTLQQHNQNHTSHHQTTPNRIENRTSTCTFCWGCWSSCGCSACSFWWGGCWCCWGGWWAAWNARVSVNFSGELWFREKIKQGSSTLRGWT
jgi:hypothetical protein